LATKQVTYRLDLSVVKRLSAWNLLLEKDKTVILKEAVELWESNRSEDERRKIDNIIKELQ